MIPLFSESPSFCDRDIFEKEEGLHISDTKRPKSIDHIETRQRDIFSMETTFYFEGFLRKIRTIIFLRESCFDILLKILESSCFYSESCCLPMSSISHEILLAFVEELYEIAPLG